MYNKIRIEREELYKSVWSTPLTKLAKKYNLPYLELKKVCTKLSIPLPEKNYWINKSLGKTNKITPLHEISENELSFYEIDLDDPKIMIKRNREDLSKSIAVPLTLTNPHPLIKKAKEHWTNPPKEYSHDSLRINVSKDLRHRALLILDTILKHLETKGYWFTFPAFSSATVAVNIDDIKIEIQLHEHSKRIEKIQESIFDYKYKYEYDGNLQLFFHGYYYDKKIQRNFSDGKTKKIEDKIPLFISNLEYAFQIDREWRIKCAKEEAERKRLELIKQQEEERVREENRKIELLTNYALAYNKSKILREFIAEVKKKTKQRIESLDNLNLWFEWAEGVADSMDPLQATDLFERFKEG